MQPMDFEAAANSIAQQFATAISQPIPTLVLTLAIGFVIWGLIKREYQTRLENAASTLAFKQSEVDDYKRKLDGASPDEAKARIDALEAKLLAITPRSVGKDGREKMVSVLARYAGSVISIMADSSCGDAGGFRGRLQMAFGEAKWRVSAGTMMGAPYRSETGIIVSIDDLNSVTEPQQAVMDALAAVNLQFEITQRQSRRRGEPVQVAEILITNRVGD